MKIKILDSVTLGDDISLDCFRELGELSVYPTTDPEEVAERIADADIVILNKVKLNPENLAGAKKLRLICITATGFDNVDVAYCRSVGIGVTNVAGYSTDSVVQVTLSMALSLACHLTEYAEYVNDGSYSAGKSHNRLIPVYHELAGKTWGILGYGSIGRRVGAVAAAMGCRVLAYRRTPTGAEGVPTVSLEELLSESDVLSIHVPLSNETRGLLSREKLSLMKRDSILINVARGAVLDEGAVADMLLSGQLGGFGADVYSCEPLPAAHPYSLLRNMPNVILTPHMAWAAYEARCRCIGEVAENIRSFLKGERRSRLDI